MAPRFTYLPLMPCSLSRSKALVEVRGRRVIRTRTRELERESSGLCHVVGHLTRTCKMVSHVNVNHFVSIVTASIVLVLVVHHCVQGDGGGSRSC